MRGRLINLADRQNKKTCLTAGRKVMQEKGLDFVISFVEQTKVGIRSR